MFKFYLDTRDSIVERDQIGDFFGPFILKSARIKFSEIKIPGEFTFEREFSHESWNRIPGSENLFSDWNQTSFAKSWNEFTCKFCFVEKKSYCSLKEKKVIVSWKKRKLLSVEKKTTVSWKKRKLLSVESKKSYFQLKEKKVIVSWKKKNYCQLKESYCQLKESYCGLREKKVIVSWKNFQLTFSIIFLLLSNIILTETV